MAEMINGIHLWLIEEVKMNAPVPNLCLEVCRLFG